MKIEQHQFHSLVGQSPPRLTVEQACREKTSNPTRLSQLPDDAKIEAPMTPGKVCLTLGMGGLTEKANGERAFMDEKELLTKLPISRRTLGNWKATGVIPYVKIGRRCLYDWPSVHGALLRRQKGGQ